MNVTIDLRLPKHKAILKDIRRRLDRHGLVPVWLNEWRRYPYKDKKVYVGYAKDVIGELSCLAVYPKLIYDIGDLSLWRGRIPENQLMIKENNRTQI